ncbi:MAG: acetyl-CoA carboxylase carboxyltransferase component [Candidatus Poriferisodalaceae bacterium]|jgi:acetyl-CoA carboxylase carboxyltransferase component
MKPHLVHNLDAAKHGQLDHSRPEAVAKVHGGGKLTARERIAILLDPDSEVEYGSIAAVDENGEWVAEAGGIDFVGTVAGHTVITSSTDYTDRGGGYGAGRLERLIGLAHEHRWPVVFFVDGGGSRARHPRIGLGHQELSGAIGRFQLFDGMAELSGWAPSVAIVSGPSFAGHASIAGFSDFVISTPGSSIGMGGPPMVEAALGVSLTPNELAGSEMHELTGGIDCLAPDEHAAIAAAKRYLSFLYPVDSSGPAATAATIAELVPEDGPYDMGPVIEALVDDDSFFELRPAFARSVITGFARMEGHSVGVLASQPAVAGGAIDESAAVKVARFVELCDSYDFPIVALIDSQGCVTTWPGEDGADPVSEPGTNRWHARPIMAHQHRTVPTFAIQIRHARHTSSQILAGPPNARSLPLLHLAWPTADVRHRDGYWALGNGGGFDDVIDPAETRRRISRMLAHLPDRAVTRSAQQTKKHPVDTW